MREDLPGIHHVTCITGDVQKNVDFYVSIYFREPGGVLFEIATDGPGFTVDESPEALGSGLQLPPQAERNRQKLKFNLPPIVVPTVAKLTLAN